MGVMSPCVQEPRGASSSRGLSLYGLLQGTLRCQPTGTALPPDGPRDGPNRLDPRFARGLSKQKNSALQGFCKMGDTGLETVGGGAGGHGMACLLGFGALKLAGICSEWNLEWNHEVGRRPLHSRR